MNKEETLFNEIRDKLCAEFNQVHPGQMMREEAMQFEGKVFAFYTKTQMVFKLGRNFDPGSEGIVNHRPLSPFKNKPPLSGWFVITNDDSDKWELLSRIALQNMKNGTK